jgi:porin
MDIVEAFYEGGFFFDSLTIALGKMDFTGRFDASEYADDECGQFLNAAFVDDPTIPFPAQGLGIALTWDITDTWYLMGGVIDAQGDSRETGFRTALHKEDFFFYALETGKSIELNSARGALPGNYRVGMWVDGQDKARLSNDKNYRDDIGVYTSCDQVLYKENGDPEDTQGLAAFLRYGWASSKYNEITKFFSAGLQYQGLIHSRDDDVVGLGFAHGTFSGDASDYTEDYESVWEVYYNAQITPWLAAGPSLQYITNPGGVDTSKDAVVVGFRAAVTF